MTATVGSLFGYYGSKNAIAGQLVSLMPEHRGYVEPFAGSLAVLRAKQPSPFECVNDLDGALMTFWTVLRDRCDELERLAALTPHARQIHEDAWPPREGDDDLTIAWRVWTRLSQGRGGHLMERTGWRHHQISTGRGSGMPTTLAGYVGRFSAAAERLRSVSLECRPALDVVRDYGRDPLTLMYVDPPYLLATRQRKGYAVEYHTPAEHRELAEVLHQASSMVVLSGYPSPLYDDELYPDWHRHEIPTWTGQGNSGHDGNRTEVVWSNIKLHKGLW